MTVFSKVRRTSGINKPSILYRKYKTDRNFSKLLIYTELHMQIMIKVNLPFDYTQIYTVLQFKNYPLKIMNMNFMYNNTVSNFMTDSYLL